MWEKKLSQGGQFINFYKIIYRIINLIILKIFSNLLKRIQSKTISSLDNSMIKYSRRENCNKTQVQIINKLDKNLKVFMMLIMRIQWKKK